jgi:hypothetical protein
VKLHRANISYMDGVMVLWGSDKRELQQQAASACAENEGTLLSITPCEVPTDKKGLVSWLNSHFDTDNG